MKLTPSQELGLKQVEEFLKSSRTCMCISGKPGVGKSFFIKECVVPLAESMHKNPILTATTNKAANVIGGITTYSAFGLKMQFNNSTGKYEIDQKYLKQIYSSLLIVDEASMLDKQLLDIILNNIKRTKVIFVGDMNQLPPIGYAADVFNKYPVVELTDVVRQKKQDLIDCIESAKECIKDAVIFKPVESDNVHIISDGVQAQEILKSFGNDDKILSYTNKRVIAFNQCYRNLHNKPNEFRVGDLVVNKSYASPFGIPENATMGNTLYAEEESVITDISEPHNVVWQDTEIDFKVKTVSLLGKAYPFYIPCSPELYRMCLNSFASQKSWDLYYFFKEKMADLRDNNACTVHASQGSTYSRVFVDYTDIVKGRGQTIGNKARMLYVALSRAKEEIFIYKKKD